MSIAFEATMVLNRSAVANLEPLCASQVGCSRISHQPCMQAELQSSVTSSDAHLTATCRAVWLAAQLRAVTRMRIRLVFDQLIRGFRFIFAGCSGVCG